MFEEGEIEEYINVMISDLAIPFAISAIFSLIVGLLLVHLASRNATSGRSCWGWILTDILMCIPVVNIIMLFIWAFGSKYSNDDTFKCWARLILIAMLTGIIFVVTFTVTDILLFP